MLKRGDPLYCCTKEQEQLASEVRDVLAQADAYPVEVKPQAFSGKVLVGVPTCNEVFRREDRLLALAHRREVLRLAGYEVELVSSECSHVTPALIL